MGKRYSLTTKAAISGVIIDLVNFWFPIKFNYSTKLAPFGILEPLSVWSRKPV
jgi:hypothetical protein